ncbi:acyl-CoA dehydrogenase [Herbaspirillum rubrisubalbicans]|uniref:Acyl-CoA dehydrogenase n=2 Tax=Herbaspirillum TaxID=963 RepID=A0ABX9BXE1_9BURK|nr:MULTISPECIES: acyl-CoA dehydrogenase family protein [Herbaspirillum]RAM62612.1 acyl-CoA dehydrogenase [Herbaspirillum rubrisubalbicans]RAN43648.1 acyl-CoA dehydrogenase [Herbaspirillum rubrisubalbicans]
MLLSLNTAQRNTVERFAEIGQHIAHAQQPGQQGFDWASWNLLRQQGLWQLIVAPAQGGSGEDWWCFSYVLEALARTCRSPALILSIIAQAGMVRALAIYGSPSQRNRYLSAILKGEPSATGIAEPTTGTDVRSINTLLTPEGNGFLLNGTKFNIAHAPLARFTLVVAKLADGEQRSTTLVLLDNDQAGVTCTGMDQKLGLMQLPTGSLQFDQVRIESHQLLGKPKEGLGNLINIISLGRLYYGLVAAAILTPLFHEAVSYARKRQSFDSAIDQHQYVQQRLVDMKIGMERNRWMAYGALGQLLEGHPEAWMSCSISKLSGVDDLVNSATGLLRMFGSLGYHSGPVSDFLRDALGFCSVGGTEEMHRKNIFNQITRLTH